MLPDGTCNDATIIYFFFFFLISDIKENTIKALKSTVLLNVFLDRICAV